MGRARETSPRLHRFIAKKRRHKIHGNHGKSVVPMVTPRLATCHQVTLSSISKQFLVFSHQDDGGDVGRTGEKGRDVGRAGKMLGNRERRGEVCGSRGEVCGSPRCSVQVVGSM